MMSIKKLEHVLFPCTETLPLPDKSGGIMEQTALKMEAFASCE